MKLFKLAIVCTVSILFAIACAKTEVPSNILNNSPSNTATVNSTATAAPVDAQFAAAKTIYDQKCVKCHQATGEGGKIQIDTASLKVPNFRDPRNQDDDDSDYIDKVEHGASGKMPAFKNKLTDDEIKSVVGYIRHEFQGK